MWNPATLPGHHHSVREHLLLERGAGLLPGGAVYHKTAAELQRLFEIVGNLDALQAVASYRESLPYYCEPELRGGGGFELEAAYHPLVQDPVPNSIRPEKKGVLVTGSNMSGKSTFLRTVGLSALFAQTIHTVCASAYRAADCAADNVYRPGR